MVRSIIVGPVRSSHSTESPVLITGANGYVGNHLFRKYLQAGLKIKGTVRELGADAGADPLYETGDLADVTDWHFLDGVEIIVHTAGAAHIQNLKALDAESFYTQANCEATLALATAAVSRGVKKFIYISSASVYGDNSDSHVFTENDALNCDTHYGMSKKLAEEGLLELSKKVSMEIIILRPAMIFGGGCPGNFKKLVKLVKLGFPLPFGSLSGARSFLCIDDLCELITKICLKEARCGGVYNVASADVLELGRVCKAISIGTESKLRIFKCPRNVLFAADRLLGSLGVFRKLDASVVLSVEKARDEFSWEPSISTYEQMCCAAARI